MESYVFFNESTKTPRFSRVNLKHPNISTNILHTVFYKFPEVLAGRICLKIKSLLVGDHLVFLLWHQCLILEWY